MKKAPKKPKSLYGNYRMYTQSTYAKRQARFAARGKNSTQGYWRKGLYSRPGHPPFYHDSQAQFNLRTIVFGPITGSPKIPTPSTRAGDVCLASWAGLQRQRSHAINPIPRCMSTGAPFDCSIIVVDQRIRIGEFGCGIVINEKGSRYVMRLDRICGQLRRRRENRLPVKHLIRSGK